MGIYEELGVERLINARCILGRYGDSIARESVLDAMREAAQSHVYMSELRERVNSRIADLTNNEAAMVCSGAACGGMLAIAACMTGLDEKKKDQLPGTNGMPDEVIMHRRGRWSEDVTIRPTGVSIREIDGNSRQEIEKELRQAISSRTAAIFMVSFGRTTRIPLDLAVEVGRRHEIPVVVDAAYDVPPKENLWYFTQEIGVDLAIFSGGKGLCGPASTGIVVGRDDLVKACELNNRTQNGIGLGCKVGKEELAGIDVAVRDLIRRDEERVEKEYRSRIANLRQQLSIVPFLQFETIEHGRWGDDFGLRVVFPEDKTDTLIKAIKACREQNPRIEISTGPYYIYICVSSLKSDDDNVVSSRIIDAIKKSSTN